MGGIVAGLRPISNSLFDINYSSPITRGILAGKLWPRSTYINISSAITRGRVSGQTWPMYTTSNSTCVRVAGLKRHMSTALTTFTVTWGIVAGIMIPVTTNLLAQGNFKTFFIRNFIVIVTIKEGIMDIIMRQRSYDYITPIANNTLSVSQSFDVINGLG